MQRMTMASMEYMAHQLAKQMMEWDEPIPPFNTRFPGRLESCIETPFATYDNKDLYPTLINKAAILFYLLTKNHPFQNGNKRIAVTSLMTFFYINGKWISMTSDKLYKFAIWVASQPPENKDFVVPAIEALIAENIKNRDDVIPEQTVR